MKSPFAAGILSLRSVLGRFRSAGLAAGLGGVLLSSCGPNYARLPTFSAGHHLLQAVVEAPAGTTQVRAYDSATNEFRPAQLAGHDQRLRFLPYPGNYGFIPGTRTAPARRYPRGHPLPVLVLAESQPAGTVLEVLPVALVLLDEAGAMQRVVVAVPARPSQRVLPGVVDAASLARHYPAVQPILSHWFRYYATPTPVRVAGWQDEQAAHQQIRAAMQ